MKTSDANETRNERQFVFNPGGLSMDKCVKAATGRGACFSCRDVIETGTNEPFPALHPFSKFLPIAPQTVRNRQSALGERFVLCHTEKALGDEVTPMAAGIGGRIPATGQAQT